jgi:ABC-type Fe3+ transport system substrate-binding protein
MSDQFSAVIPQDGPASTGATHLVAALIANQGEQAGWRYVEFFTANIGNPNTRRTHARACSRFFACAKIAA